MCVLKHTRMPLRVCTCKHLYICAMYMGTQRLLPEGETWITRGILWPYIRLPLKKSCVYVCLYVCVLVHVHECGYMCVRYGMHVEVKGQALCQAPLPFFTSVNTHRAS